MRTSPGWVGDIFRLLIFLLLMIVDDFRVIGVAIVPAETNPPLIIDPDAVLSQPVSAQRLQPVPRWHSRRIEIRSRVNHPELAHGHAFSITGQLSHALPLEYLLSVLAPE